MEYKEDQLRERLLSLIHRENITQRELAEKLKRQQSNISQILTGERRVPRGFIQDVINAFPNINHDWLMFGEGSMYVNDNTPEIPQDTKPRLPRTLSEGHIPDYIEGPKRALCMERPIVTLIPQYDFSLFLKTDRMSPNYRRGDELFFKKTRILEWGSCYLLDTAEGPKFKKIYEEKGGIRCVSFNREEYPDFIIPKDMIFGYYKCVGFLRIL
ncbi:MAG: XRE family transcriptional regulator [Prevotella sp.]|nr:XRE family transcriptional regulator [Prevotella sp.]